jgi:hypothetical protein
MYPYRFSEEIGEKLMSIEEDMTFEELKEIIDNETIKE